MWTAASRSTLPPLSRLPPPPPSPQPPAPRRVRGRAGYRSTLCEKRRWRLLAVAGTGLMLVTAWAMTWTWWMVQEQDVVLSRRTEFFSLEDKRMPRDATASKSQESGPESRPRDLGELSLREWIARLDDMLDESGHAALGEAIWSDETTRQLSNTVREANRVLQFGGRIAATDLMDPSSSLYDTPEEWQRHLAPHHQVADHIFVLALAGKSGRALQTIAALLSVGFPLDKMSLFYGPYCKILWDQGRLRTVFEEWDALRRAPSLQGDRELQFRGDYEACDPAKRWNEISSDCAELCCTFAHQMLWLHAFKKQGIRGPVLVLEDDVMFGPSFFHNETLKLLRDLRSKKNDWGVVKLADCNTFTDLQNGFVLPVRSKIGESPGDLAAARQRSPLDDFLRPARQQFLQSMDTLDRHDMRWQHNYCTHAYLIKPEFAELGLGDDSFPQRQNCDDELLAMMHKQPQQAFRFERFLYNQNHSISGTLPSSCNIEELCRPVQVALDREPLNPVNPRFFRFHVSLKPRSNDPEQLLPGDVTADNNMCGYHTQQEEQGRCFRVRRGRNLQQADDPFRLARACASMCLKQPNCTSYTFHPPEIDERQVSRNPSQFFLCEPTMNNILKSLPSKPVEWIGLCCLRFDDVWAPYSVPPFDREEMTAKAHERVGSASIVEPHVFLPIRGRGASAAQHASGSNSRSQMSNRKEKQLYRLYGNTWTLARAECQKRGLDLCPHSSMCNTKSAASRFIWNMQEIFLPGSWLGFDRTLLDYSKWSPVLDECNSWTNVDSCKSSLPSRVQQETGNALGDSEYWFGPRNLHPLPESGKFHEMMTSNVLSDASMTREKRQFLLACCPNAGGRIVGIEEGVKIRTYLALVEPENSHVLSSLDKPLPSLRGSGDFVRVLRVVINHSTSGFFASMAWALAQLRFAKAHGLLAYVDHGPCVLCGYAPYGTSYKYADASKGPNAWEYFFEPDRDLLRAAAEARPLQVLTMDSDTVWAIQAQTEFSVEQYGDEEDPAWTAMMRARAREVLSQVVVRQFVKDTVEEFWASSGLQDATRVLGVHMRGTDKQEGIGGRKVGPDEYKAWIDHYLEAFPDTAIFVATDSPSFLERFKELFPNAAVRSALRSERNIFLDERERANFDKGLDVLVDALLLSKSTFLLHSNSAVSEFAVYWNSRLDRHSLNVQFRDSAAAAAWRVPSENHTKQ